MPCTRKLHLLAVGACTLDDLPCGVLEDPDELATDHLALLLRVGDAGEHLEETGTSIDHVEVDARGRDEVALHLLGFARTQEAVVHEDAREPVADRALNQSCSDGGVHAAGERAEHPLVAHSRLHGLDLIFDDAAHRPGRGGAGDLVEEVLEDRLPVLGVQDLRVELHARQPPSYRLRRPPQEWPGSSPPP